MRSKATPSLIRTLTATLSLILLVASPCAAASPEGPRRVLVIPSYNFNYLGSQWFLQGVMAEFTERSSVKVSFLHENLQLAAHPLDRQYHEEMAASLKIKYGREKPDLIIVQYKQALQFMERYGREIFGETPVVFAGLSLEGYSREKLPAHYTGVIASFSASRNVGLIIRNHPGVRKIYVVAGSSPVEQDLMAWAFKEGAQYKDRVELVPLTNLTFGELLERIGGIKGDAAIMYLALQLDRAGKVLVPAQAAGEIARAARVPVYGMLDTYMGSGITGGYLIFHEGLGRRAAQLAAGILAGKGDPATPLLEEPIGVYRFDGRKLKRWGVDVGGLPEGSRIEFQEFGIWESYQREIVAGIILILLQAALIAGLLTGRGRRVRMAQALRRERDILARITETSPVGIVFVDRDGRIDFANSRAEQILGLTKDQILQRSYNAPEWQVNDFQGNPLPEAEYPFALVRERRTPVYDVRHAIQWGDGRQVFLSVNAAPLIDEKGEFEGMVAAVDDITERVRAEEALRESEEKYRRLAETAHDMIMTVDLDYRITYANKATRDVAGGIELVGANLLDFTPPEMHELQRELMRKRREGFTDVLFFEWEVTLPNGKVGTFDIRSASLTEEGKPAGVMYVVRDITERKRADQERQSLEERLHRGEKMEALGKLAGGVAHDLNNVLGVSMLYAELLQEKVPEGNPLRTYADQIFNSTAKGAAIIEDLLTLARRGVAVSKVIDINGVLTTVLHSPEFEKLRDLHPAVTFRTELGGDLLSINGSPVHLEKTVFNLISNAAEAISGQGQVLIRTENRYLDTPVQGYVEVKEGDYVVLTVSDTGEGIRPDDLNKIFEPFYTRKQMGRSGTGLGLAIVWGTVKDHNGYIDVRSVAGNGATFTLYFPVTREKASDDTVRTPIEAYLGHGETVLVVDDVAEQREVATVMLSRLGYRVKAVSSGEEAVEYLKANEVQILVLDMIMEPGIDGLETYRRVREIHPRQKAIMVSGFSETEQVRQAQALGAGPYVKKPYVMERIGLAIRQELNKG